MCERFDVYYWQYEFRVLDEKLDNSIFDVVPLESLIIKKQGVKDGPGGWLINKSEYVDDGVPMLRGVNVLEGRVDLANTVYITEEKHEQLAASEALSGDILITMRGTFGRAAILPESIPKANMNAALCRIRLADPSLSEYLMWYLNSDIAYKQFKRHGTKAVQDDLNLGYIKSLRVILPDDTNRKSILSNLLNGVCGYSHKQEIIDSLLNGMRDYILSALKIAHPQYATKLCYSVTLKNIIEDKTLNANYYHSERMAMLHSLKSNISIPVYKLSHIVSFHRDIVSSLNNAEYLGLAGVESHTGELSGVQEEATGQAFVYEKDDILYGRLRPYLNKVLLAEKGGVCSTEFHVMRVIDTEKVLPEYVAAIMRSDLILSQTKHMLTGNTHPRISNDDVKNLYIPVPELSIQKEIVKELRNRRIRARVLKLEAEQEWQDAKEQFEKALLGK